MVVNMKDGGILKICMCSKWKTKPLSLVVFENFGLKPYAFKNPVFMTIRGQYTGEIYVNIVIAIVNNTCPSSLCVHVYFCEITHGIRYPRQQSADGVDV